MKVLVAGCSSGIGEYLFNYYNFHTHYETEGLSRTTGTYIVDATDPVQVFRAINKCRPDILINCIGQAAMNLAIMSSCVQYEHVVTNNIKSTFLLCREAGRGMLRNGFGRIINFGSCSVDMEIEGESLYTASKSAVVSFSRVLAKELGPTVTVNCISPGPCDTRLIAKVKADKIQKIIDRQIIKKKAQFSDIAHVCDWLISEKTSMITGQNIYINGAG